MTRFLSVIPIDKAREILLSLAVQTPDETVSLIDSLGRTLRRDIRSDIDIPGFDRSTVDGYAVSASDTTGASDTIPSMLHLAGRISMGMEPDRSLKSGMCMYIPTGAFLPAGANAVVMIEYCEEMGDEVLVTRPVASGENIVCKGEDFSPARPALLAGTRITSRVMGVLAACGVTRVPVAGRPHVAIISTGNEIVPVDTVPDAGRVRDVNTWMIAGFITEYGGTPIIIGTIPDESEAFEDALSRAVESADVILVSGGSSKGERDMCADIIATRGEVMVHGIALSPGKPTIIGKISGKPVIGLPGHPASAYVVLTALVRDLITMMTGEHDTPVTISGLLTAPVPSARGREDYVRVMYKDDTITPVFGKSGLTNTLVQSDGLLRIPAEVEGYETGSKVIIRPWR